MPDQEQRDEMHADATRVSQAHLRVRSILGIILGGGRRVLETLGSRESINRTSQATVLFKHESLRFHPMPPWITKESHRPRVSNRTMSYRLSGRITVTLVCFKKRMAPSRQ